MVVEVMLPLRDQQVGVTIVWFIALHLALSRRGLNRSKLQGDDSGTATRNLPGSA